ncbi:MAG: LPS-assembly protein LptD, partial [Pseudomonadota bacterium]
TWPVANRWLLATGWNYSLDDKKGIEAVLGIKYESCCWAFRTAARRYITDDGENSTNAYFFQLVLKGLAPVGQNVTEVLSEAIGGYRNRR